jgi:excisionase family DNA binding protein
MTEPMLLGVRAFARAEGIGRDTVYGLVKSGRIRAVRVNRRILIPRSELADFPARELADDQILETASEDA